MKHFLIIIIFNLALIMAQAQDRSCRCNYYKVNEAILEDKLTGIAITHENLKLPEGEIYSLWNHGDIFLNDGEIITNRLMRYDGLSDQLVVSSINEDVQLVIEKSTIKGFDINKFNSDKILHYKKITIKNIYSGEYHEAFLQVLVSGKTSLYAYRKIQHVGSTNELQKYYSYVIIKEDGTVNHFLNYSRRYIASLFPEKKDIFKPQLRKQHNRVRDEEHLIKAIELYNSL